MNLGTTAGNIIRRAAQSVMRHVQQEVPGGLRHTDAEPLVFAVANCYPTRIVLYAAAFQGGWRVEFMKSLRAAVEAARSRRPKAVFYDHGGEEPHWDNYCSALSRQGIPFILLAHKNVDETFLVVLAAGGYQAWGDPLTSEDVVKAVEFAGELSGLAHVPVG